MAPSIPVDLSNKRVLVADDNAANRKILQLMLHKLGASVTMCEDGDIAIGKWDAEVFDLLLLDINMPRVAGTDVIRQIRHMEHVNGRERTPAIAVTANAATEQVSEYLEVGFDHCIGKPFTLKTMSVALSDVLADPQSYARRVKEDSQAAFSGRCHGSTIISS